MHYRKSTRRDFIHVVGMAAISQGTSDAADSQPPLGAAGNLNSTTHYGIEPATARAYPPGLVPYPELEESVGLASQTYHDFLLGSVEPTTERIAAILETICGGSDDSQDVELYNGTLGITKEFVNANYTAVGQLQWNSDLKEKYNNPGNVAGVRWGSGALISDDLFLTAGHCFDRENLLTGWKFPRTNAENDPILPPEIATNIHVNFNYQLDDTGKLRQEEVFHILELTEYRLGNLDFAVARLDGAPGQKYGKHLISSSDAEINEIVTIMGHPIGLPKRVMAGPATDFYDTRIGYSTLDTRGGNSGSSILNSAGKVVGVHTNGGCADIAIGHNYGHRVTSLLAISPILKKLA